MRPTKVEPNAGRYTIEFAIAALPKTPNQMLGAHWTIRSGHAKKWRVAVTRAIFLNGGPPSAPLRKALIECVRISSGRMDADGLSGSFKAIVDALKHAGVIEDDSPDHVRVSYRHERGRPRAGSVRVRVEELTKPDEGESNA